MNYQLAKINFLVARTSMEMNKLEDEVAPAGTPVSIHYPNYNQHVDLVIEEFIDFIKSYYARQEKFNNLNAFVCIYHADLLSFMGYMISLGFLGRGQAKVFLYEDEKIVECFYDHDGILEEPWPLGWCMPDSELYISKFKEKVI